MDFPRNRTHVDDPACGSAPGARWLRLGLLAQCVAAAWLATRSPTAINGALFIELGVRESWCNSIDRAAAVLLPLFAVCASVPRRARLVFLLPIALWFLTDAIAAVIGRNESHSQLAPLERMVRYLVPIALPLLASERGIRRVGEVLLRVSAACVFAAHGAKAWLLDPQFQDLLWSLFRRLRALGVDVRPDPDRIDHALHVIGGVDLTLAALVLLTRWRTVALYMAAWGLITAGSRLVLWGMPGLAECALRALNAAVPFYLYLTWRRART